MNIYQIFAFGAFIYSLYRVSDNWLNPAEAFKQYLYDYDVPMFQEAESFAQHVRTWKWSACGLLALNVLMTFIAYF